jgi:hypothetical protein
MKLETARRNFRKNGIIYGVSEKNGTPVYQVKFHNWEDAIEWYYIEERDFRERHFISKRRSENLENEGLPTWEEEEYYKAMY